MPTTMVTGGAGYIGSHVVVALLEAGHEVVVVDNLVNGSEVAVERAGELGGGSPIFEQADLTDRSALRSVFADHAIDAVVHLAGLKAVGESVAQPLRYYRANVIGGINLVEAMADFGVWRLVLSSSATVYGDPQFLPITEDHPVGAVNPYGRTKLMQEEVFADVAASDERWRVALLRYFNPVGAHASGRLGEDPSGVPNNLMPFVMQVAVGRRDQLVVFGDDYDTPDGTCIRDYVHVVDLADGHVSAIDALERFPGWRAWNLGTGAGHSVLEVLDQAEAASGQEIPRSVGPRRPGDAVASVASVERARVELHWEASRDLATMCADHWRWQTQNPDGYPSPGPSGA
jgi:UDP-glucose 4-epimerase